jgi:tRNA dimethylallyltransferase
MSPRSEILPPDAGYVILAGPTASGKTALALRLAEDFDAEIVSADSMMVYRHMDIGTAKPDRETLARIPHHLVDIKDPDEHYDAALFSRMAASTLAGIRSRGRRAIVAGGTGLYLRALEKGLVEAPPRDPRLRRELEAAADEKGTAWLFAELLKVDPDAGEKIMPGDRVRIIRALEIFRGTGVPASVLRKSHGFRRPGTGALFLVLDVPGETLRRSIARRAARMVEQGLIEETEKLMAMGYQESLKPMKALNYRHACRYLDGSLDRQALLRSMETDTWHFARRQMNWFRSENGTEFVAAEYVTVRARAARYFEKWRTREAGNI